ncbi:hypothetical protein GUJ93_ZPchr0012g21088 [Zizania palustris]|uniref:Uncharacterized protein n=1 Tax=Zizania palustris TaxID=103762 RepID=A0A8J5WRA4_ZIZPA|nr:hypothetical protein GUJ93_ZPchr0012g21088 [Zizania palustris]
MLGGGSVGGVASLDLDLLSVIQAAVVGLVLFSAAVIAVRRAASQYFVVDAAGFTASYDDHHHHHDDPMPPLGKQQHTMREQASSTDPAPCAACGDITTKKCSGCKRVRYCSQGCQSKHWQSGHKFKCKQMKNMVPADRLSSGAESNRNKSAGFGPISLVPARRKLNKVIFPYDDFLNLCNWMDLDYLPCGLFNCGNSCFANVVLQCLSCTRPLAAYLLGADHIRECYKRHDDWCFFCGNLGVGRQEDAHEFMRFAIDKMQSACLDEFGGEKAVDLSTQETTLIQHIFGGRLQSQVQCTACGMVSNRYENMMDLTVEIHGDIDSLEECLDQFTAVEWLDGDNKYKCNGCSDYAKAQKRLTVQQAPNILTITLKRFQSGIFGKLNKRVTFPMNLDIMPYMSSTDGSDQYDLYAVVVHLDMLNASFFGHYICYIKNYRGHWYKIDDCKVMAVDQEEVHAQGAYMLLYSRRTARCRPLIAVEELMKQPEQLKVFPSTGQNHLVQVDVQLNCESPLEPSEDLDLQVDFESSNKSLHTIDQESDLDLHRSIERDKFTNNDNMHPPVITSMHALDELGESTTMRSLQFGKSTCEVSSAHSSAEKCEEHVSCSDSVDFMEVDTEAGVKVERWSGPILGNSVGLMGNSASVLTLENRLMGKRTPVFVDKPSRINTSFAEGCQSGDNGADTSQELNGHCNGDLSWSEQGVLISGDNTSSPSTKCYGNKFATFSNGNNLLGKTLEDNHNNYALNLPPKDCQGSMPFLHRGVTRWPYSMEKPAQHDGLPFSNGREPATVVTSASSVHGMDGVKICSDISLKQQYIGATVSSDQIQERQSSDRPSFGTVFQYRAASIDNVKCCSDENGHAILAGKNTSYVKESGSNRIFDMNGCSKQRDATSTMLASEEGIGSKTADHDKYICAALEYDGLRPRLTSTLSDQNGIDAQ